MLLIGLASNVTSITPQPCTQPERPMTQSLQLMKLGNLCDGGAQHMLEETDQ